MRRIECKNDEFDMLLLNSIATYLFGTDPKRVFSFNGTNIIARNSVGVREYLGAFGTGDNSDIFYMAKKRSC